MTPVPWPGLGPPGRTPLGLKANEDYSSGTNGLLAPENLSKIARILPTQGDKSNPRKFSYTVLGCSKAHHQYPEIVQVQDGNWCHLCQAAEPDAQKPPAPLGPSVIAEQFGCTLHTVS